jgi:ATP-dependent RNA helicase HelY
LQSLPTPQAIRTTIERSFGQFQNRQRMQALQAERDELIQRWHAIDGATPPCCPLHDFLSYQEKRASLQAEAQRLRTSQPRRGRRGRRPTATWGALSQETEQRVKMMTRELSHIPCHRCPERQRREARLARSKPIREALAQRTQLLEHLQDSYWDQFLKIVRILERFGYLTGGVLSPEGRLIAALRHDNELLVARVLFSGILDGLTPAELVALLSCLGEEARESEPRQAWLFLRQHPQLEKRLHTMGRLAQELLDVQRANQVTWPVSLHIGYLSASYRWASGEADWTRLVQEAYGGHEGDLIRAFRRLIDLCRQLADSPEVPPEIRQPLRQGIAALDRDIVFESALI